MKVITPIPENEATGRTAELYGAVKSKLGLIPNMVKTMAVSTPVVESYLNFSSSVGNTLTAQEREVISLAVAEVNGCQYCLSAHSTLGKMSGLSQDAIIHAREGYSDDSRQDAIASLAFEIAEKRGNVTEETLRSAIDAGLTQAEVAEVVANVALNFFTNIFNNVTEPEIDFPKAKPLATISG